MGLHGISQAHHPPLGKVTFRLHSQTFHLSQGPNHYVCSVSTILTQRSDQKVTGRVPGHCHPDRDVRTTGLGPDPSI